MLKSSLEKVLNYEHEPLLQRFMKYEEASHEVSKALFQDVKKFLWASAMLSFEKKKNQNIQELPQSLDIFKFQRSFDEMWHHFILFTKDYMDFCDEFLGMYVHHQPHFGEDKRSTEERKIEYEKMLLFVAKYLGEEFAFRFYKIA